MEDLLDKIELLQNMRLRDGDILVITVPPECSSAMRSTISGSIDEYLKANGFNNRIIIKERGIDFEILRKEDVSDG